MNINELQKKETEATNSPVSASTDTETSVTSDVMNPQVSKDSNPDVLSKELSDRIKTLDTLVKDLTKNFVKIGYELVLIRQKKLYKELDFKSFEDFVQTQYGFSRSSAYNFINVCLKYSVKDDAGQPTKLLSKEYAKFSSSQLVAMLKLNDEERSPKSIRTQLLKTLRSYPLLKHPKLILRMSPKRLKKTRMRTKRKRKKRRMSGI